MDHKLNMTENITLSERQIAQCEISVEAQISRHVNMSSWS